MSVEPAEAREATGDLSQAGAGAWRLRAHLIGEGAPAALGMTAERWAAELSEIGR